MALTVAERQARYRAKLRQQKRVIHELPGLPASYRDRLARLVAVERTQLRATISKLRRKRGESALGELRDAERALRWWGELAASQGLEVRAHDGRVNGPVPGPGRL
jgi:hypothetical protein